MNANGRLVLAVALALSVGWGIRGNYGHENGAMIPGALAAMTGVLLAGRKDWYSRIPYFAFFGALGWSFGGSISYMQVIAYTHSGQSLSVLYGFACLWVIGFLWGAIGGAGTALPACVREKELITFFPVIITIFVGWLGWDALAGWFLRTDPAFRQNDPLYWYDTDWVGVSVALIATAILGLIRRRFDSASSLVFHMAVGWWAGFLILVVLFGWRMTPPRGDNWAGCLGMVIGLWVYLERNGLRLVTIGSVMTGIIGGIGFAGADFFKLAGIKTGWVTNWHSILEQSYGFINGIGIGILVIFLARRSPVFQEKESLPAWPKYFAAAFVLIGITYLNLFKNVEIWVNANAVPRLLYGWPAAFWFDLGYALVAGLLILLMREHHLRASNILPNNHEGKAQFFFALFLFWIVIGNFERALVSFAPQRLITEGLIHLNAILCVGLVLLARPRAAIPTQATGPQSILKLTQAAIGILVVTSVICWSGTRLLYGQAPVPYAGKHIRFGPQATATKSKPDSSKPHP